ncbi:MAG: hypothetical protein ACM3ZV_05735 [Bacillota bacterium]
MENDRTYFMRRAAQERSAASRAQDRKVRAVHEALADRYHALAHSAGPVTAQSRAPAD